MQERLAQMDAAEGRIAGFLVAAKAALEQGDFQLADKRLAEAENAHLVSTTLPGLENQYKIRFERGHAALLAGDIGKSAQHWEQAANYYHFFDVAIEAERRHEYCMRLRAYGYRYKSAEALYAAENGLERNLAVWTGEEDLQNWCKTKIALGDTQWRLSQYDDKANYRMHIANYWLRVFQTRQICLQVFVVAEGFSLQPDRV